MTRKELEHKIRELSDKIQAVGSEAIAGTKSFSDAKVEMDGMEVDLKKYQDEHAVVTSFEETKAANMSTFGLGQAADADAGVKDTSQAATPTGKSFGEQFVNSAEYKAMIDAGFHGQWKSQPVELKATLTEGTAASPGIGFALAQTPTVLPGLLPLLFANLTVADLFPSGTTDSPIIRYIVETAVTNAAATVVEGAAKPLSDLTLAVVDERLRKIATLLQVSDEMLQDFGQMTSYLDNRLMLFIKIAEELQLLLGDGTGENLTGVMNRSGKAVTIVKGTAPSLAGDNDMDVILRQITAIRVGSFLEPDAIVIDPASWQTIQLSKASTSGVYFGGGPFMGFQAPSLWGKRVVVTPRMTAGVALVGAFQQGAMVFRKGGIVVDASNQHNDNFGKNQTTLRAEERLALAVFRPAAFGSVTGL